MIPDPAKFAWPCDDYLPPLTCWTTPKPKTLICEGCRDAFPKGAEVQVLFAKAERAAYDAGIRDTRAALTERTDR